MQTEEWRPVTSLGGLISASSHGRIRREARSTPKGRLDALILAQRPHHKRDYLLVQFVIAGKMHTHLAHSLVLEAFAGPRPPGCVALHRDDNRTHNAPANLRWGTRRDNYFDWVANGGQVANGGRPRHTP